MKEEQDTYLKLKFGYEAAGGGRVILSKTEELKEYLRAKGYFIQWPDNRIIIYSVKPDPVGTYITELPFGELESYLIPDLLEYDNGRY